MLGRNMERAPCTGAETRCSPGFEGQSGTVTTSETAGIGLDLGLVSGAAQPLMWVPMWGEYAVDPLEPSNGWAMRSDPGGASLRFARHGGRSSSATPPYPAPAGPALARAPSARLSAAKKFLGKPFRAWGGGGGGDNGRGFGPSAPGFEEVPRRLQALLELTLGVGFLAGLGLASVLPWEVSAATGGVVLLAMLWQVRRAIG